ncbi:hypothetical protein L1D22_11260 [Vibrio sp. Isolate34]|uniref:hypothetical protein n=1 Tax=Vibrio sp. Isolate34 TaxID=2908540 RepID=UPI001EFCE038|nr:hypothetical protein [Vibrio sp. Isolate34]MCG9640470.1 hypothetical protein [Vibrio sp. Isolate34]
MIDGRLKRYWLAELEQSAKSLEKLYRSNDWNDELEFSVEKSIFLGFYAIRKLKESGLLPNNVISLNWKITTYPIAEKSKQNKFINDYQLLSGGSKQLSLEALCNQFVHSNHFSPFVPDNHVCAGFFFASDRESKKELYYMQLVSVINVFLSVVHEKRMSLELVQNESEFSVKLPNT